MLLNPLSVYTTNLQDNWYEDGKEKEEEKREEEEEEEEEGEGEKGETVRRTRVDTSRDPRWPEGKRRMGRRWEWFLWKREGRAGRKKKGKRKRVNRGNSVEITVIVNHAAYRCTRVGTISGYREPFLDLPMLAKVGTMVLSNY